MEEYKIQLLREQVNKIDEILQVLKGNFDVEDESECANEYSFLSVVKENLSDKANGNEVERCPKQQIDALSYIGKTIRIVKMEGETDYNGQVGLVTSVDGQGQLHGTWSGSLAVQPDCDTIEIL